MTVTFETQRTLNYFDSRMPYSSGANRVNGRNSDTECFSSPVPNRLVDFVSIKFHEISRCARARQWSGSESGRQHFLNFLPLHTTTPTAGSERRIGL